MKGKISIPQKSRITTMPKRWVESGYTGQVPFIANASTIILMHPKATLDDVEESLNMLIKDIQLRRRLGLVLQNSENSEPENSAPKED